MLHTPSKTRHAQSSSSAAKHAAASPSSSAPAVGAAPAHSAGTVTPSLLSILRRRRDTSGSKAAHPALAEFPAFRRPRLTAIPKHGHTETLLIAECGLCHDGQLSRAVAMIAAAALHGAHAVKFQKRSAAKWFDDPQPRPAGRPSFGATVGQHRRALEFSPEQHRLLKSVADAAGVLYGVSVWDCESIAQAITTIEPHFIKVGRPAAVAPDGAELLQELKRHVAQSLIHVSCRDEAEATDVRRIVPAARIYYCPGGYPDVDAEVRAAERVAALEAEGISLHTTNPDHAAEAVRAGVRFVEHHFALPETRHGDARYSLGPTQWLHVAQAVRAARADAAVTNA